MATEKGQINGSAQSYFIDYCVLIGWRLRSVLGTRNDDEKPGRRADAYRLNRDAYENPPEQASRARDAHKARGLMSAEARMRRW